MKKSQCQEITFLIKVMNGGGAERVVSVVSNGLLQNGYKVTLILTHQKLQDAVLRDIDKEITVLSVEDCVGYRYSNSLKSKVLMGYGRLIGKISKTFRKKESEYGLIYKYYARNYSKIQWLKGYFRKNRSHTVIAFLYDTIFLTMASVTKGNKVIISERGDPQQSVGSKTTMAFLHKIFPKAAHVVFQSPDVQQWYRKHMRVEGDVIFNPIKNNLPEAFEGNRKKRIVNFCRISKQKNLELLVRAFARIYRDYPEYTLYIYGDEVGDRTEGYLSKIKKVIEECKVENSVYLMPGRRDIHSEIVDYTMFVSSSDFEGMSNSMLESLAIGLPVVCTDCPAGGARAIIRDHENGLLVPIKDEEKLYLAMKEIIENPDLAKKISKNGILIRGELSVNNVIEKWMEIIND